MEVCVGFSVFFSVVVHCDHECRCGVLMDGLTFDWTANVHEPAVGVLVGPDTKGPVKLTRSARQKASQVGSVSNYWANWLCWLR